MDCELSVDRVDRQLLFFLASTHSPIPSESYHYPLHST